jgi:uncharacterized membrane protein YeaQ/YmgE (transglycosylase-associated protein family)
LCTNLNTPAVTAQSMGYISRTMLLSFMIVVFWCVIYTFVGVIVLVTVPALRVSLLNLIAFVIGALIGSTIFSIASGQFHSPLDNYPDAVHFVGAVTGGVVLVWLKMRLLKSQSDSRLL